MQVAGFAQTDRSVPMPLDIATYIRFDQPVSAGGNPLLKISRIAGLGALYKPQEGLLLGDASMILQAVRTTGQSGFWCEHSARFRPYDLRDVGQDFFDPSLPRFRAELVVGCYLYKPNGRDLGQSRQQEYHVSPFHFVPGIGAMSLSMVGAKAFCIYSELNSGTEITAAFFEGEGYVKLLDRSVVNSIRPKEPFREEMLVHESAARALGVLPPRRTVIALG